MVEYRDFLDSLPSAKEYERYITGLCPFHEDTSPSLLVFPDGYFSCLACSRRGTWKTLWNKLRGQPVQVKREVTTRWEGPKVRPEYAEYVCYQAHEDLLHFTSLGWYLELRGVDNMIETCELGYWKGWYTIPVRDRYGNFQTVVYRAAPHVQEATGIRYWSNGKPVMYVPDWHLLDRGDYIFIVFGMLDALAIASLRLPVVTTTYGKDSFRAEWLDDYKKQVYIIPDEGEYSSALRLSKDFGWRGNVLRLDYPDNYKDPADFAANGKIRDLEAILVSSVGGVREKAT